MSPWMALAGSLWLSLVSTPLQAKEPTPAELAAARQLFADATALEARSDWSLAVTKLQGALAIKETPGLRYHLAHCEEQLGALVAAERDYERSTELIRGGAPAPDVEPLLPPARRRLEARIAKLNLVLPAGTSAVAELDGRPLPPSSIGTTIRLDPGTHHVDVRAPGHADFRGQLTLVPGEHRVLKLFFDEAADPAAAGAAVPVVSPSPAGPSGTTQSLSSKTGRNAGSAFKTGVLIGEAALTVVGIGVGIGSAIVRGNASGAVDAHDREIAEKNLSDADCGSDRSIDEACGLRSDAIRRYDNAVTWERVGFITAGAAAGLFVATWFLWPSPAAKPVVALSPRTDGAMLLATGSF
jgi:hypothetical protein